jgi:hypothetical protein
MYIKWFHITIYLIVILSLHCYHDAERDNPNDPGNFRTRYPDNGVYGENLLKDGNVSIAINTFYSLCIQKKGSNRIRVYVPLNSSFDWSYYFMPDPVIGWIITSGSNYRFFYC